MSKPIYGLILGGILGVFDGLTAWFTPEVRNQLLGIVIGSTFKGLVAGLAIGFFARRVQSLTAGVIFGLAVGLVLAWIVAAFPDPNGKHYYAEIMLPGALVGAIVGYATQKYRSTATRTA